jgi:dTDP-4-amino-4,6-dideoxygalactose transaminase
VQEPEARLATRAGGGAVATVGVRPAVVSLHATKVLGAGEDGFVIGTDANLIQELQKQANFGSGTCPISEVVR